LRKIGSTGVLLPNLEARLVRDDTSSVDGRNAEDEDVKPGEPGELWIRGPSVMKVIYCILLCLLHPPLEAGGISIGIEMGNRQF
jgi:hypothetical protein